MVSTDPPRDPAATAAFHRDLADVMREVGYVQKDGKNEFHNYKYASAEAVLRKVNTALSAKGIAVGSRVELVQYEKATDERGKTAFIAIVKVVLFFQRGEDGLTVEGLGQGSDKGDKAVMKANTAAIKYALANAFMISWGDDPEASAALDEEPTKVEKKTPSKAPKTFAKPANDNGVLPPDIELLKKAVAACETIDGLAEVKPKIQAAQPKISADDYKALVRAYQTRKGEIEPKEAAK